MSVKTEEVEQNEKLEDDVSEYVIVSKSNEEEDDTMTALKAKMAAKKKAEEERLSEHLSKEAKEEDQQDEKEEETDMPPKILAKKTRTINFGVIGSGQAGCIDGKTNVYMTNYGIIPIKDLFYKMLGLVALDCIEVTNDNQTCIRLKNEEIYTISMNPQTGEFKKARVTAIWKNRTVSRNKITTKSGTSLTCSKKHPSLVFRPASRRKAFFSSLSATKPLSIDDRLVDSRLSILDDLSKNTFVRDIKITNNIAWLLGVFAGDGHNKLSGNEISFYCSDNEVINRIIDVFKNLPHTSIKIYEQPGCTKVSAFGLQARLFFESAFNQDSASTYGGFGGKTYTIDLPMCISAASSTIRASFLAGMIDSDGTISNKWCETSISTCSRLMADKLSCLISTIGGRSSLEVIEKHKSNSNKNHSEYFRIRLSGKLNHGPMMSFITEQITHSVKKERIALWLDSDQKSFTTSSVPLDFDEISHWMKSDGKMTSVSSLSNISGVCLKMWALGHRDLSINSFKKAMNALNNSEQIRYVKDISAKLSSIDSIELIEEGEGEFFDLTVDKYENYIAGNNGFIVTHNSRLAESLYKHGYSAVAFNTATQDLEHIEMPEDNKCHLDYGPGGASKDPAIGAAAAEAHKDLINQVISDKLSDAQMYVFCTSLGGGSGGGSVETIIDVMSSHGKPILVLTVLPMTNEDPNTKRNALSALSKLAKEVQSRRIHNLIVVDNAKIETIFSDVSQMDFYRVSNAAIVDPLDVFNTYSSKPSNIKPLDPMEWSRILIDGGGLSLYGCMTVDNYEEDTAIAEAIIENLNGGLLAEGFDLKQTKYVGAMVLANKKVWSKIPSSSINYAMAMVQDVADGPDGVFRGVYEADIEEDVVKVYSFFSGLALPDSRVEELKAEVKDLMKTIKEKDVKRDLNLSIDTGESKATSAAAKVREKMAKKRSMLGQYLNESIVDRRKK